MNHDDMNHDDMDTKESILHRMPKRPGNFGGETFREYCGLSRRRKLGKLHFEEPGVSAQDLYRAIGRRSK